MVQKVVKLMKAQNVDLTVDDKAKELVAKSGVDDNYGARPLRRAIQTMIEDKVAEAILDGKVKNKILVTAKDDQIVVK